MAIFKPTPYISIGTSLRISAIAFSCSFRGVHSSPGRNHLKTTLSSLTEVGWASMCSRSSITVYDSLCRFSTFWAHSKHPPSSTHTHLYAAKKPDSRLVEHVQLLKEFYDENVCLFEEETLGMEGTFQEQEIIQPRNEAFFSKSFSLLLASSFIKHGSSVLVGAGSPAFVEQVHLSSPKKIVVAHFSLPILALIKEKHDEIICWHGDMMNLPPSFGPFEVVFLNYLPTIASNPPEFLRSVAGLCKSGARVLISHNGGKRDIAHWRLRKPSIILHDLPDFTNVKQMLAYANLELISLRDDEEFYLAVLKVLAPETLRNHADVAGDGVHEKFPLRGGGTIVKGFGRGSKEMGIPTANIDPHELSTEISQLSKGVYFGLAQVRGSGLDDGIYKMVMNVGTRPTFADGGGISVEILTRHFQEVHVVHDYGGMYFYGKEMKIIVLGFIREEKQFKSVGELVERIHIDIQISTHSLDRDAMRPYFSDVFFASASDPPLLQSEHL